MFDCFFHLQTENKKKKLWTNGLRRRPWWVGGCPTGGCRQPRPNRFPATPWLSQNVIWILLRHSNLCPSYKYKFSKSFSLFSLPEPNMTFRIHGGGEDSEKVSSTYSFHMAFICFLPPTRKRNIVCRKDRFTMLFHATWMLKKVVDFGAKWFMYA